MREIFNRTGKLFLLDRRLKRVLLVVVVLVASMLALSTLYVGHAQDGSQTITIKGPVESISGSTWTVSGTSFEVTVSTTITGYPVVGSTVTVVVVQAPDGKLTAVSVVLIIIQSNGTPTATGTAPTATATDTTPTATGTAPTATSVASPTAVPFITIIIEGPVEKVDLTVNVVVVYGMKIKIRDDDPVRLKIKIGDHIRAKGHWDRDKDDQPIIIVVIIVIIDGPAPSTIVIAPGGNGGGDSGGKGGKGKDDDD